MRLYLINPNNPLVSITKDSYWNQFRVWKPLGLLQVAAMTPGDWEVRVFDENTGDYDYDALPRPDVVGITAFTSQATRAYELADAFRAKGITVVMGGIHASMCPDEAGQHVDAVVMGEAEGNWPTVVEDLQKGELKPRYESVFIETDGIPAARHDLLPKGYRFGSLQTTRGCPLNCSFCSVTAFNGKRYRLRPIDQVVAEMAKVPEGYVLMVDDNLFGTRKDHIQRSKELMQAIIDAKVKKKWICQSTVNMADDEELLALAKKAGCFGVFIGFETVTKEGQAEIHKKINARKKQHLPTQVATIQKYFPVLGAFIMGLDVDRPGVGTLIADTANGYGVDVLNTLILTPLPGTDLWQRLDEEGRIVSKDFPNDWQYYTLNHPVMRYANLSWSDVVEEMRAAYRGFYSYPRILRRVLRIAWRSRHLTSTLAILVTNLSYRLNLERDLATYNAMELSLGAPVSESVPDVAAAPAPAGEPDGESAGAKLPIAAPAPSEV